MVPANKGMPDIVAESWRIPPRPARPEAARLGAERWREAAAACESGVARLALGLVCDSRWSPLLDAVFGGSPFLTECLLSEIASVVDYTARGPDAVLADSLAALEMVRSTADVPSAEEALRRTKRRVALITALADLGGVWPLERVTRALSDFAGRAIDIAACVHAREMAKHGLIDLGNGGDPIADSGIIVLGMGKLGAFELNYSSDVDLIVLYDSLKSRVRDRDRLGKTMVRLTHLVVGSLSQRTADGYVFRADLRLRPDPASTAAAISTLAAEVYYESMGQNWERAALIKARPVAADLESGAQFLALLRPFVWRRHLDFNAIQDIHSIKRQINAQRGGSGIAMPGHDIKLGRGGIREIEFFAQTQQLIFGGREPKLRARGTCDALRSLAAAGRTAPETAAELIDSYRFLRTVEHRLQMIDDQQTHALPVRASDLDHIARFAGFEDADRFADAVMRHLRRVEEHYGRLFAEAPSLAGPGNLVFTGAEHDPETLATIAQLGYHDAKTVSSLIRGWHHGRARAMRSARAREILTELVPHIIAALAKSASPDDAFRRFDTFIARLTAGAQFFALLQANPALLKLLADILGSAPRLAVRLSQRPGLFDVVLSPDFFAPLPDSAALHAELSAALERDEDYEEMLGAARRWAQDRQFQTGVQFLSGGIDAAQFGAALSAIADAAIAALLPRTEADFAVQHGRIAGGAFAVLALGKLGGRELSATSDLDLVFVYEAPREIEQSDGPKPLAVSHYYARFAPRLLNALTAPTADGKLFDVDLRLRPAGNKGPLASSYDAFLQYQSRDAWTWEHMALTRARFIAGDAALKEKLLRAIADTLAQPRAHDKLLADVAAMRVRIAQQHPGKSIWDVKYVRGGLVDVEFIAQYLQLRHAHQQPAILSATTATALERLADAGFVPRETADRLAAAARLWQQVQAMLRLTVETGFDTGGASDGLKAALCRATGAPDIDALAQRMADHAALVARVYEDLIDKPARADQK